LGEALKNKIRYKKDNRKEGQKKKKKPPPSPQLKEKAREHHIMPC
jgi:hypothetical protein